MLVVGCRRPVAGPFEGGNVDRNVAVAAGQRAVSWLAPDGTAGMLVLRIVLEYGWPRIPERRSRSAEHHLASEAGTSHRARSGSRRRRSRPAPTEGALAHAILPAARNDAGPRLGILLTALAVATAVFVLFLPALGNGFVSWDDEKNFVQNSHYRGLGLDQLRWMWTTIHLGHYVPLSWMTLGLDYTLWGMNPTGYHLTNVVLHAVNATLVYFLALRVLSAAGVGDASSRDEKMRIGAAVVAALIFALHPLRVESVAWITERRDVLCSCFALGSVLAYLRSVDREAKARGWYAASIALLAASLLSKGTAVVVAPILVLLNIYPLRRLGGVSGWTTPRARRVYRELLPFIMLALTASVLTLVALQHMDQLSIGGKAAVSAYSLWLYVWKTLLPTRLSPLYAMPARVDPSAARFLVAYAAVIVLSIEAWRIRVRWPGLATAWVAFVLITLPMLGLVQNGPQIAADRYTYYAGPVVGILVGAAFAMLLRRHAIASVAAAIILVATLASMTWRQIGVWHDSRSLWSRVLGLDSTSAIALNNWGNLVAADGRTDEAIGLYRRALAESPRYVDAHTDLGVALAREGNLPEAITHLERALALDPASDDAENDWGVALVQQGHVEDAIAHYRRAVDINPDNADAQTNWGNALVRLGKHAEAIEHYQASIHARADNPDAEENWGAALAQQGRYTEAAKHFQRVLLLRPNQPETRTYLDRANALARRRGTRQ